MKPLPPRLAVVLSVFFASAARAQFCALEMGPTEREIVACKPDVTMAACRRLSPNASYGQPGFAQWCVPGSGHR